MNRNLSMLSATFREMGRRLGPAFSLDLHALALFRIALGSVLLIDLLIRLSDFPAHYSEVGVMPLSEAAAFSSAVPLLPMHLVHHGNVWQAGMFGLGLLFSIGVIAGFFTRGCLLGLWLVLGAIHARNPLVLYGADTLLLCLLFWSFFLPLGARWGLDAARYGWQGLSAVNPVGSAAYVCQIAVVYFFSFLSKTGESWRNGEAVGLVLQLDQYTSRLGAQVLSYPGLLEWLTWFTLGIELIAPLLLLVPKMKVRIFGVLMLGVMQIGFAVLMELGLFPFVSLIALIPFLRVQREANLKTQGRFESRRLVLWREGLALVCLGIMLLWNIGVSRVEFQRTRLKSILPGPLVGVVERLRLDQSWSMFSPDPPVDDGWLVFEGTLSSGQQVDLRSPQNGLSWEKPENVSSSFLGDRWKAYLLNLVQRGLSWRSMAEFLVAEWDESHSTEQKIAALRITYMKEQTLSLGHSSVEKITLFEMEEEEPISE